MSLEVIITLPEIVVQVDTMIMVTTEIAPEATPVGVGEIAVEMVAVEGEIAAVVVGEISNVTASPWR